MHEHSAECMISRSEAARLAGTITRTIDAWAKRGLITKLYLGPTGYYVRFCREELRDVMSVRTSR